MPESAIADSNASCNDYNGGTPHIFMVVNPTSGGNLAAEFLKIKNISKTKDLVHFKFFAEIGLEWIVLMVKIESFH